MNRRVPWLAGLLLGALLLVPGRASTVRISEFMAVNWRAVPDAATNFPDWIEIQNLEPERSRTVTNLAGWYLTDDRNDLRKWSFPSTNIPRYGYLVVFASGRQTPVHNGQLHASFKLSGNGEYLALVEPDGVTIATEFAPRFPQQYRDVSYGISSLPGEPLAYFTAPTPGAPNTAGRVPNGPRITDVAHSPPQPGATEDLHVTARVHHPVSGVATVMLHVITQFGNPTNRVMHDDGLHGDGAAGDGVYGATIPHQAYSPNHLIRYAITARGADDTLARLPEFEDPADFFGTVCFDPALPTVPPVLHWFAESNAWKNVFVNAANWYTWTQNPHAWGKAYLFYDGVFYAGCRVRKKGSSTINSTLNKYKVRMPPNHPFRYDPAQPPVEEFNIHRFVGDPSYIREPLACDAMRAAGVPTYHAHHIRFRQDGTNQTALFVEQQDATYLARHGFDPEGALYKADPNKGFEPEKCSDLSLDWEIPAIAGLYNKESRNWEDQADLDLLRTNLNRAAGSEDLRRYLLDHINLPQVINQMAVATVIGHGDRTEKNYYVYHDNDGTREWSMFPWDFDTYIFLSGNTRGSVEYVVTGKADVRSLFFGDHGNWVNYRSHSWLHWDYGNSVHTGAYTNSYNRLYDRILRTPATREMYLRRLRSVTDLLLGPTAPGYLESRIDHFAAVPLPGVNAHNLKTYAAVRRAQLYTGSGGFTEYTNIPAAQAVSPTIGFGALDHTPASGNRNHEFIELINTNAVAVDLSGWSLRDGVAFTFQPGTVIPARTNLYVSPRVAAFREREVSPRGGEGHFVQGPYQGQLSAAGETVALYDAGSNLISAITYPGAPLPVYDGPLRVTEIMYRPPNGEAEFIEIHNTGDTPADLTGLRFTEGVTFDFGLSAITNLPPGGYALAVRNLNVFHAVYAHAATLPIAGQYTGNLNNSGEQVTLYDTQAGARVFAAEYRSSRGWPVAPDGAGHSLVPRVLDNQTDGRLNYGGHWRASAFIGGSPGGPDPEPQAELLLNEFMAHTDYDDPERPEYDSNDWIELFHTRPQSMVLNDWFLSDRASDPRRWEIPAGTVIGPNGRLRFDEVSGFNTPVGTGFGIDKAGGFLYLSHLPGGGADRVVDSVRYKGQENDVTLGRHPDGGAHWHTLTPTPDAPNAVPAPQVVVAAFMYHPAPTATHPADNTNDEYIALYNPTPAPVPLWTAAGPWRLDGGVDYTFPSNTTLAAGAMMYLTGFDPVDDAARAAFHAAHGFTEGDLVLIGPYNRKLSNQGERIALERPQAGDGPDDPVSWVIMDEVIYFDDVPWPPEADGTGLALLRQAVAGSGNDPANWAVTPPALPDANENGLIDAWEIYYFGGTNMPGGGPHEDWDENGVSNWEEFVAGTDPTDPHDVFAVALDAASVRFFARAAAPELGGLARYYALEWLAALTSTNWAPVPGYERLHGTDQPVVYPRPPEAPPRFYRGRVWLE